MTEAKLGLYKPGTRDPGSVTRFVRQLAKRPDPAVVPCQGCTACCRSAKLHVDLRPHEVADWPDAVRNDEIDAMVLPKREDGSCVYFIDGHCSVYARRPTACRVFDCRYMVLLGVMDIDDPTMRQALTEWAVFKTPTAEDKDIFMAAKLAVMDGGVPDGAIREYLAKFVAALSNPTKWAGYMKAAAQLRTLLTNMPANQRRQLAEEAMAKMKELEGKTMNQVVGGKP